MYIVRLRSTERVHFEERFETLDEVHAHIALLETQNPGFVSDDYALSVPRGEDQILVKGSLRSSDTQEMSGEVYDLAAIRASVPDGWQLQSVRVV